MVEDIEQLTAELCGNPFLYFKLLRDREVPGTIIRVAENVLADRPVLPKRWRNQDRIPRDVAAGGEQRGRCKRPDSGSLAVAKGISCGGGRAIAPLNKGNSAWCCDEVFRIAV